MNECNREPKPCSDGMNALQNCYYESDIEKLRSTVKEIKYSELNQNLSCISFPDRTRVIVNELSSSLQVDKGLIFICWIASVCACTLGKIRVKFSEFVNSTPLSLIIVAGFPSGYGKSQALSFFTKFFTEKTELEKSEYDQINKEIEIDNKLITDKISIWRKKLAKITDEAEFDIIRERIKSLEKSKKELLKFKKYIVGSTSKAAYMKLLSDQNFAIRLESDGGFLTKDHAMLLRKAWSNEPISEIRVTSDDRICSDPFIVDVVLTQIKPYLNYVQKDDFIETGVLSRTIHYIIDTKNSEENSKKHDISQSIQKDIYETLNRIFIFSSRANDNLILKLDSHAEEKFSSILKENTKSLEDNNADLITRYGECVLRIAALLHISESDDSINDTIDFSSINTAGEIMKFFYNHAIYSRNYVSHESLKCAKLIGNYMLDQSNNGSKEFLITDLKQKYKYKYDSNTVEEALKKLINLKVIRRIRNKSDNPKGGRPKSDMISVNIGYSKVAND